MARNGAFDYQSLMRRVFRDVYASAGAHEARRFSHAAFAWVIRMLYGSYVHGQDKKAGKSESRNIETGTLWRGI